MYIKVYKATGYIDLADTMNLGGDIIITFWRRSDKRAGQILPNGLAARVHSDIFPPMTCHSGSTYKVTIRL